MKNPIHNAKRFILSAYKKNLYGMPSEFFRYEYNGSISDAAHFMADVVILELGDGDGENGGMGSLKNCIDDIRSAFMDNGKYSYAECSFYVIPIFD